MCHHPKRMQMGDLTSKSLDSTAVRVWFPCSALAFCRAVRSHWDTASRRARSAPALNPNPCPNRGPENPPASLIHLHLPGPGTPQVSSLLRELGTPLRRERRSCKGPGRGPEDELVSRWCQIMGPRYVPSLGVLLVSCLPSISLVRPNVALVRT